MWGRETSTFSGKGFLIFIWLKPQSPAIVFYGLPLSSWEASTTHHRRWPSWSSFEAGSSPCCIYYCSKRHHQTEGYTEKRKENTSQLWIKCWLLLSKSMLSRWQAQPLYEIQKREKFLCLTEMTKEANQSSKLLWPQPRALQREADWLFFYFIFKSLFEPDWWHTSNAGYMTLKCLSPHLTGRWDNICSAHHWLCAQCSGFGLAWSPLVHILSISIGREWSSK